MSEIYQNSRPNGKLQNDSSETQYDSIKFQDNSTLHVNSSESSNKYQDNLNELKLQDDFTYEPVTYEEFKEVYESLKEKFILINLDSDPLFNQFIAFDSFVVKTLDLGEKSCCGQVKANGYYSFVSMIKSYFVCINNDLDEALKKGLPVDQEFYDELINLIDIFVILTKIMEPLLNDLNLNDEYNVKKLNMQLIDYPEFHRNLKMFKRIPVTRYEATELTDDMNKTIKVSTFDSLPLYSPHISISCDAAWEAIHQEKSKHKDIFFRKYLMCHLDVGLQRFFKIYASVLPFIKAHLYQYPLLVFDSKFRSKFLSNILSFPTINFPFEFWNISESLPALWLRNFLKFDRCFESIEVRIPTQNSIIIIQSPTDKIEFNDLNEIHFDQKKTIRCKYIIPNDIEIEKCTKLCLQIHGGGFFSQSCDSHEIYTRKWADTIKIPILAIDYTIKQAFPVGLQDCFDVYVWLRKAPENEIKSKLGFYPKKIVIVGDSAGGNLGFGVTIVLNDLRTEFKSQLNLSIQMPDGLVFIYPVFVPLTYFTPSKVYTCVDLFLPLGLLLLISEGINGLKAGLKRASYWEVAKSFLFPSTDPRPWFECSKEEFYEKFSILSKTILSPYLCALFYDKLDQITDVPMNLIGAEFDSFLDDTISVAKIYKGPLKVDILKSLMHGFMNLPMMGKRGEDAVIFCGKRLAQIFESPTFNS